MARVFAILANAFPLWVLLGAVAALINPPLFTWFLPYIIPGLAIIMLGMGITLDFDDFKDALKLPKAALAGIAAQFIVMPCLGWAIAHLLSLPSPFAVGLILVACCPGGTASNVVTYIAKANVALSVLMTMCSTLAAVALTPILTKVLAGHYVEVHAMDMFLNMIKIVILPVFSGLLLHRLFPSSLKYVVPVAPLIAVVAITLICAAIIGANADAVLHSGMRLLLAVFLLHCCAFALGYAVARALGFPVDIRRTIAIEVGMQNSGLGTGLARLNFSSEPLTTVPCAISATFHSIIGSFLAGIWRLRDTPSKRPS
ncbi:MAG: bile acid:sodium symporter family protein [Verrucomicrobiota bacterium]